MVLVNQVWREHWCCVCRGALHFYQDRGDPRTSLAPVLLHGCEVVPGLGPKHPFAFRILRSSTELAALEVLSAGRCTQRCRRRTDTLMTLMMGLMVEGTRTHGPRSMCVIFTSLVY